MKLEPCGNWVIGRTAITKAAYSIVLLNQAAKVTRYVRIDVVGPEAAAAGFNVGDFVIPRVMNDMFFNEAGRAGSVHFVTFQVTQDNAVCKVSGLDPAELVCLDGTPFVANIELAA